MSISVIVPARNAAPYIRDAIATVLAQGEDMRELIVVDDGSTDETCAIVRKFDDPRIRLIAGDGRGVSAARNAGARVAIGEWLMFLDADDRLRDQALSNLIAAGRQTPNAIAIYGDYSRIDSGGRRIGVRRWLRRRSKPSGRVLEQIVTGNFIVNGGVMIVRAAAFASTEGFSERMSYCEDWYCWCRLAALGEFKFIPRLLLDYRLHRGSAMGAAPSLEQDVLPALNDVFNDASIARQLPRNSLPYLRRAAEQHLIIYAATQAMRLREYRKVLAYAAFLLDRSSSAVPRLMLRLSLAPFGI